jgi:hypothetical protein
MRGDQVFERGKGLESGQMVTIRRHPVRFDKPDIFGRTGDGLIFSRRKVRG